jgi:hypothetical protein
MTNIAPRTPAQVFAPLFNATMPRQPVTTIVMKPPTSIAPPFPSGFFGAAWDESFGWFWGGISTPLSCNVSRMIGNAVSVHLFRSFSVHIFNRSSVFNSFSTRHFPSVFFGSGWTGSFACIRAGISASRSSNISRMTENAVSVHASRSCSVHIFNSSSVSFAFMDS